MNNACERPSRSRAGKTVADGRVRMHIARKALDSWMTWRAETGGRAAIVKSTDTTSVRECGGGCFVCAFACARVYICGTID